MTTRAFRRRLAAFAKVLGPRATLAQLLVLLEVELNEGERITDLAEGLPIDLSVPGTSIAVNRLANGRGALTEKRAGLEDLRTVEAWLTPKGRRLFEQIE